MASLRHRPAANAGFSVLPSCFHSEASDHDRHSSFRAEGLLAAAALPLSLSSPLALADSPAIRIGWQKGSTLSIVKARGNLEARLKAEGVKVTWTEFPAGPQMLEGLNVGSIDIGVVGETPLSDEVIRHQQQMADTLAELKLIPKQLDVASVVWRPAH